MAFSPAQFLTASLREHPRGEAVAGILACAINAVEPGAAIRRAVYRKGDQMHLGSETFSLRDFHRVAAISIGKAGVGMAAALGPILGPRLDTGLIVTKHADGPPVERFTTLAGGHPVPDDSSLVAAERVLDLASMLTHDDLLFCLISGGGSALVASPVEGVSLADLQDLTNTLLSCGARVEEINILRRALDRIKGGGLAYAANGAKVVTLIMSDVVGSPLEAIASGPTVPNPTTPAAAMAVIEKYGIAQQVPPAIVSRLRSDSRTRRPAAPPGTVLIVASNLDALQAALAQAETEGFRPYLLRADLQGEARQAGHDLATGLRWLAQRGDPVPLPGCLAAGGETTVTVHGPGRGGRNCELALAASISLADFPRVMMVTLGSDGEDGTTGAAGAVVTGETFARARRLGLDPYAFLSDNDSYTFFAALDDLVRPGPTGTNVNDLVLMFGF